MGPRPKPQSLLSYANRNTVAALRASMSGEGSLAHSYMKIKPSVASKVSVRSVPSKLVRPVVSRSDKPVIRHIESGGATQDLSNSQTHVPPVFLGLKVESLPASRRAATNPRERARRLQLSRLQWSEPAKTTSGTTGSIRHISSSSESRVEGTIGEDAAGIAGEAETVAEAEAEAEALVAPEHLNEKERQIWDLLMEKLQCTELEVQDISGGCGSMYGIEVVSERFRGMGMLKQQRLVNEVLKEEIQGWHGVQLKTRAP